MTSVTMTLRAIYLGKLGDRIGHRPIAISSSLACGIFSGLQVFISMGWQLVLLHALFGLGLGGIIPCISALFSNYRSSGEEGSVYGK